MGVVNLTPDSFYAGSRHRTIDEVLRTIDKMIAEGVDIVDLGAVSTRPFASEVPEGEERRRLLPVLEAVVRRFPQLLISVDTFRATVAKDALALGAHIINDIYAGRYNTGERMFKVVAHSGAGIVIMHMRGTPFNMQANPAYTDVVSEDYRFLHARIEQARATGVRMLVIDPGFGFGKRIEDNYRLAAHLRVFHSLGVPLLVGISRKSMLWRVVGLSPSHVLPATCALHAFLIAEGVHILRVHDVDALRQVSAVLSHLREAYSI